MEEIGQNVKLTQEEKFGTFKREWKNCDDELENEIKKIRRPKEWDKICQIGKKISDESNAKL
ncbi:hypothetical protein [Microcoleus sp. herbarium14]|uniref:hypothetical protein n=1 Tax=Microcoleus sp. herbarium14 TaxID=3055439 RepID=UPI002FD6A904